MLGRPIEITDFDYPKLAGVRFGRNARALEHAELSKISRFCSEPATLDDVIGQDFAFNAISRAIVEQRLQFGPRVERWQDILFVRALSSALRLEREPVRGVAVQREEIRRFLNRWKMTPSDNF